MIVHTYKLQINKYKILIAPHFMILIVRCLEKLEESPHLTVLLGPMEKAVILLFAHLPVAANGH